MKLLKTMQRSLKWMLALLIVVVLAGVALGGVWIKKKLDERAARQAEYERIENEKAAEITMTFLPGKTMFWLKERLLARGFSESEIDTAFAKQYSTMAKLGRPATLANITAAQVAGAGKMLPEDGAGIEGFVFPETINFLADVDVETILARMATELDKAAADEDLAAKFQTQGLTFYQGLTLASIVEAETGGNHEDAAKVAAIFYNRLRANWTLGSDVTAIYAANLAGVPIKNTDGSTNWSVLTFDSPWNTRVRAGLPPTPINSPSLEALLAVAEPDTESMRGYYYFLTGDDNITYFARNEVEHQQNIREHCQVKCASL
ncbi:MAG: endolytic transglycosylase MltG [Candidatus Nomurabacteria bacterium]|jgi:UPF0755 protein|nr:endolytic transglycosylase MltG [Candidatus Nomurabacteria bacterium]